VTYSYWLDIEQKVRKALAAASKTTSHVAWLDAMADVPSTALSAAIDEIDRLRQDGDAAHDQVGILREENKKLRDAAVALGKANDQVDRLTRDVAERDEIIAAMSAASQRVIDHAVQARERISPLGTFPVVTRIKPTVSDTNPMEAEHPTSDEHEPRPRVRPSVDRRDVYSAVTGCPCSECERKRELQAREAFRSKRGGEVEEGETLRGKLHTLVARTPKGGVILCTTEQGKKQVDAMCALQGRADIRVAMAGSWGETDAKLDAERSDSEGDGVD